jgi:hypothetical protein
VFLFRVDAQYLRGEPGTLKRQGAVGPDFKLTSPEEGVLFDIDGDGDVEQVAWTPPGAEIAFLALDLNGDGQITSGKELLGSQFLPSARTGANALSETFKQSEGRPSASVEAGSKLYDKLLLWVDGNHNGISEPSELRPAKELFTAIGMGFFPLKMGGDEHGNLFWFEGWAEVRTGGPEQGKASVRAEHVARIRAYFEIALKVR